MSNLSVNEYVSCNIELPPSEKDKFSEAIRRARIYNFYELLPLTETEFCQIKGMTPIMVQKTKALLSENGWHFGMSEEEINNLRNEKYFKEHPEEEPVYKMKVHKAPPYTVVADIDSEEMQGVVDAIEDTDIADELENDMEIMSEVIAIPSNDEETIVEEDEEDIYGITANEQGKDNTEPSDKTISPEFMKRYQRLKRYLALAYEPCDVHPYVTSDVEFMLHSIAREIYVNHPLWKKIFWNKKQRCIDAYKEAMILHKMQLKVMLLRGKKNAEYRKDINKRIERLKKQYNVSDQDIKLY